jgi:hypothetical protein
VGDKGYHSSPVLLDIEAAGLRPYLSEPDRGRAADVGKFLASFKEFPQRQKADSFNLDAVPRKLSEAGGSN